MTNRAVDWNEGFSKDLRDLKFSQEFILVALDEGLGIKEALAKVIRAYGVKEFAKKAKLPSSNIVRAISPSSNPTQVTFSRLLKPFGLKLSATKIKKAAA